MKKSTAFSRRLKKLRRSTGLGKPARLRLLTERLEERNLLAGDVQSPWQNPFRNVDVNGDGRVTALDAFLVIGALRSGGPRSLSLPAASAAGASGSGEGEGSASTPMFVDVNGDQILSPLDAFMVINNLRAEGQSNQIQFDLRPVAVGQVTALNEVQNVFLPQGTTGGTFTLTVNLGTTASPILRTTAGIPGFNANPVTHAAQVQSALEVLAGVGVGNVAVESLRNSLAVTNSGSKFQVTFKNALGGLNLDTMTINTTGLAPSGSGSVVAVVDGGPTTMTVNPGATFGLQVLVQDIRSQVFDGTGSDARGVGYAALDVVYNNAFLTTLPRTPTPTPPNFQIAFGPNFDNETFPGSRNGTDTGNNSGQLDELGAIMDGFGLSFADGGAQLVLGTITFQLSNTAASSPPPITATNDTGISVPENTTNFPIDVLANDVTGTLTFSGNGPETDQNILLLGGVVLESDIIFGTTSIKINGVAKAIQAGSIAGLPAGHTATIDTRGTPDRSDDRILYAPPPGFNGPVSFRYTLTDDVNSQVATVSLTVTPVNDAPVFTNLNGTPTFVEDGTPVVLDNDASISDMELDALSGGAGDYSGATLTLRRNGGANANDVFGNTGTLAVLTQGGALIVGGTTVGTVTTNSGGTLLLTFNSSATTARVNSVLRQIAYSNTNNNPPASVRIDVTINDGNTGSQGLGGSLSATGSVIVTITAVNDAPAFSGLDGTPTFNENGAAVVLDNNATVSDPELDFLNSGNGNYAGATLMLRRNGGADANDVFGNSGTLGALLQGGNLTVGGTTIGTVTTNSSGTLLWTFNSSATRALVNSALQQITYRNSSPNPPASATINYTLNDGNTGSQGTGGAKSAVGSVVVTINAVNDPPSFSGLDAAPTFVEDGPAVVLDNNATVSDPELNFLNGGNGNYSGATLTLVRNGGANADDRFSNTGTLNALTPGGALTVGGTTIGTVTTNSGGTLLLTFNNNATRALVNSALQQIAYSNVNNNPPAGVQINFTINDGNTGAQGPGGAKSATGSVVVSITATNDAPSFSGLDATPTFVEDGPAIVLDNNATIADPELDALNSGNGNYNGATLMLRRSTGANADDVFGNSGTLGPLTQGGSLVVSGTTIGTVTTNSGGTLLLTFNNNATRTRVNSVLQQLTYTNPNNNPPPSVQINFTINDGNTGTQGTGGAKSATGSVVVAITPTNDAPTASSFMVTVSNQSPSTHNFQADDVDNDDDRTTLTYMVTPPTDGNPATADGSVTANNPGGTFTFNPGSDFASLMPGQFRDVTFTYKATDRGGLMSTTETVTVRVVRNQPPVARNDVFSNVSEDATRTGNVLVDNGNGADFDPEGDPFRVISFQSPTGTPNVSERGAIVSGDVSTATTNGNFTYDPRNAPNAQSLGAGEAGVDRFTYTLRDTPGGTSTGTVTINLVGVNDAPVLNNGTLAPVPEDTASPPGQTVGTIFDSQFSDPDSSGTLAGIAVIGNTANATMQGRWQYSSNGGTNWFDIGTVAEGTTALALSRNTLIRFVPVANFNGAPAPLVVRALDNTYSGGFSTTAGTQSRVSVDTTTRGGTTAISTGTAANLSTNIIAVNDAPTVTAPSSKQVIEDQVMAVTGVSIADIDAGAGNMTVTLSVGAGTISVLPGVSGGVTMIGGNNSSTVTMNGTVAQINTTLAANNGLRFVTAPDSTAQQLLTINVNDNGNTGVDPSTIPGLPNTGTATNEQANATITINVTPVNDQPTLNSLGDVAIDEDALLQTVNLTGISAGGGEMQLLTVTAASSDTTLIPNPTVSYTSPNANGTIQFKPAAERFGTAVITVTVKDNGGTVLGGVDTISRSFTVTVNSVNDAPVAANDQFFVLKNFSRTFDVRLNDRPGPTGVPAPFDESDQTLSIKMSSSPTVQMQTSGPNSPGTLTKNANDTFTYTPAPDFEGVVTFTYSIEDSGVPAMESNLATVTLDVINFVPSTFSGFVYVDTNNNGVKNTTERALSGVPVNLSGIDAIGRMINITTFTKADGSYLFDNDGQGMALAPSSNYKITASTPAFMRDGIDTVITPGPGVGATPNIGDFTLQQTANDQFTANIGLFGGANGIANFGELGLEPQFISVYDFLASTPRTGILFAIDRPAGQAETQLWYSLQDGWSGYQSASISLSNDLSTATITAVDSAGVSHVVVMPTANNPNFRFQGQLGTQHLIRIYGSAADFGLPQGGGAGAGGEGEGGYSITSSGGAEGEGFTAVAAPATSGTSQQLVVATPLIVSLASSSVTTSSASTQTTLTVATSNSAGSTGTFAVPNVSIAEQVEPDDWTTALARQLAASNNSEQPSDFASAVDAIFAEGFGLEV